MDNENSVPEVTTIYNGGNNSPTNINNNNTNHQNGNNPNKTSLTERASVVVISSQPKPVPVSGSVIQTTATERKEKQLISVRDQIVESDHAAVQLLTSQQVDDEQRRRREVLARRPSYRKILNELSSTDVASITASFQPDLIKSESLSGNNHLVNNRNNGNQQLQEQSDPGLSVAPSSFIKLVNQGGTTIQLAASPNDGLQGIPTLTMTNSSSHGAGGTIQYVQSGQDGPFFLPVSAYANGSHFNSSPVTVTAADLQSYQMRGGPGSANSSVSGTVMLGGGLGHGHVPEEASKKRELRLLKNREAAKECRRKKKEYIKCLENRVAVLENQNKALIEELKQLKDLYCQKD